MLNLFKRKNVLIAKTDIHGLFERFPIMEANHCIPNWFKEMKPFHEITKCPIKTIANLHGTVKNCYGVRSLLNTGFIVQAWSDMSFIVQPNGALLAKTALENKRFYELHNSDDAPGFLKNKIIIKLYFPWFLYGNSTKFLYTPAVYHSRLSQKVFMPSGILEFKKQHAAHVFICADIKEHEYEILIKAGDPLMQLIPLDDEEVILKSKYESNLKMTPDGGFYFCNAYNRARNHEKRLQK